MICQNCQHCRKITSSNGKIEVSCMYNGVFYIHETVADRFTCPSESFEERKEEEIKEPPKPNIVVILKSGRDVFVYSGMIASGEALTIWFTNIDRNKIFTINNFVFNPDDVSAVGYIGE